MKGAVDVYDHKAGAGWRARLPLPKDANINLVDADDDADQLFVTVEGFLDPTSLWLADAAAGDGRQAEDPAGPVRRLEGRGRAVLGDVHRTGPRSPTSWCGRRA